MLGLPAREIDGVGGGRRDGCRDLRELALWAARWRYGKRIPHEHEFRSIAHELDPRITITCPPFGTRERAQRKYWHMSRPRCRRTYRRGRRDKVACRSCCDTYAA